MYCIVEAANLWQLRGRFSYDKYHEQRFYNSNKCMDLYRGVSTMSLVYSAYM